MNASGKGTSAKQNGKTKAQLQQELLEANKTIDKLESELVANAKALQKSNANIDEIQKQLEESRLEQREAERQRQHLQNEFEELNAKLNKLEIQQAQETETELIDKEISSSKSTFQIDIYPRQGQYQGRIKHPLSKDKKAFGSLDEQVIIEFISNHLPQLPDEAVNFQSSQTQAETSEVGKESLPEMEALEGEGKPQQVSRLRDVVILPESSRKPSNMLHQEQPFEIQFQMDLSDLKLTAEELVDVAVRIYAKRLAGGTKQIVGQSKEILPSAKMVPVKTRAIALQEIGTYLLEAAVSFSQEGNGPTPEDEYLEVGFLNVY
ncbi:MAG: hypothetical protein ACE5HS_12920 [bacterium]